MRSAPGPRLAAVGVMLLVSCASTPDSYPPPVQRKPFAIEAPGPIRHFVFMKDPGAAAHILADINGTVEAGGFRWTGRRPTLRFRLPTTRHARLAMHFSIHDDVFESTGPITVSFSVNGRLLDKVTYDSTGEKRFEKAVDPAWLRTDVDTLVSAELDKIMVAGDGVRFGLILLWAGFRD